MLMKQILRFLSGTVKNKVYCDDSTRIAGILMKKYSFAIVDTKIIDKNYFEYTCISFYNTLIKKYLKLMGYTCVHIESKGMLELYDFVLKRPGLAVGIVLFIFFSQFQSEIVWDIVITGNDLITDAEVIKGLKDVGFKIGGIKNNDMLGEYCNMFIMNEPRVSRISINMGGNIAFVEIGERAGAENDTTPSSMSGLFSKRNCIVELPIAESGTKLVKKGEIVYDGQMVISPIVKGDNDTEYIVGARGRVYGRTLDYITVCIPFYNAVTEECTEFDKKTFVTILGKDFSLPSFDFDKENVYYQTSKRKLEISDNIFLPFFVTSRVGFKYLQTEHRKNTEEARSIAYKKMYSYIADENGDGETVFISFDEYENENYFVLKCTLESIVDIVKSDF